VFIDLANSGINIDLLRSSFGVGSKKGVCAA